MRTLTKRPTGFPVSILLSCLLFFLPLTATADQSKPCGSECSCGCVQGGSCTCPHPMNQSVGPCGPKCSCGCAHGAPCTCSHQEKKTSGPCGPKCTCGCHQGHPCTCHQEEKTSGSCGLECSCGCPQGYPCFCPQEQELKQVQATDKGLECCYWSHTCEIVRPVNIDINGRNVINEGICTGGIWLPEDAPLFRPFMADPRQVTYSAGWRFNDNAMTKNNIDVSYGDSAAIYRWFDVWPWHGQLQIDLEGALWAIFNPCYESAPLMNADYYGGLVASYSFDQWQFRLRGFHISSHVGDEFLLNHPDFDRKNPSAEYLDFFISHDLTEEIRIFGGLGWVVEHDKSFKFSPFYSALGAEVRLLSWGFLDCKDVLYGCPIFGMYFRQSADFKRHIDATYVLGYEFGKLCGLYRRLRFYMEYHDGYSVEGQFYKTPTDYFSLRVSYGF